MSFQEKVDSDQSIYELLKDEKYFIESYKRMETFLSSIRNEKVWKNFKLIDAEFSYEQTKENFSVIFSPLIEVLEIEIKFLQWLLCPMDKLVTELDDLCDRSLENISILNAKLASHQQEANSFIQQHIRIEYLLIESEIILLQGIVELKNNNFMSSAHKFLKSYQKMNDSKKVLSTQYQEYNKKTKYETAYFLKMCENRPMIYDQKLLDSLASLIDVKLAEIRETYQPSASESEENASLNDAKTVNDSTLQATRDLLHLKQLYRELSQEYQRFEEERRSFEIELHKKAKNPSKVKRNAQPDDGIENSHPNLLHRRNQTNGNKAKGLSLKNASSSNNKGFSWNIASVSETCGNFISNAVDKVDKLMNPVNSTDASTATSTETSQDKDSNSASSNIVNSLMSPKKVEMPVVSVLLPRISDVAKMLDIESSISIKRRKSQTGSTSVNLNKNLAHLDLASEHGFSSPVKEKKPLVAGSTVSLATIFDDDDFDFKAYWDLFKGDFHEAFFIQCKSRIAFIDGIFSVGLSILPKSTQWVLEIVKGSSMNLKKGLKSLYKVHLFEESRWCPFASLVLLNLPKE
jgi:hypothetical protein